MTRSLALTVILIASAFAVAGQQRPLLTDDIDITPPGAIEISAGVDFLQNVKLPLAGLKGDLTRVGDIRLRNGFAPNVELEVDGVIQDFLAINSQTLPSPIPLNVTGNSSSDFGDITVAAKVKLLSETRTLPAFGLKFGFQMPNTDQSRGIGTNQINVFTKLIFQKKFGRGTGKRSPRANIYGNIGLGIMSAPLEDFSQNDVLLYGLAGVFGVTDRINVATEVNGRISTRSQAQLGTESVGQFRAGIQIKASGLRFDAATIFGLTRYSPRTGITFGVTYVSPVFLPLAK